MNKKISMPLLIGMLALALLLAACDRPSANNAISNPPTSSAQDISGQPTLNAPSVSAQETADASGNAVVQPNAPEAAATETPLPPLQPNPTTAPEPTAVPAQPTSQPVVQSTPAPTTAQQPCSGSYVVQTGDRLFSIGRACNVNPYAIAQANNIVGPYFFIYPGQTLIIPGGSGTIPPQPPPTSGGTQYTVRPGDNLFRISLIFGKSMQAIAAANGLSNYNLIFIGQVLTIP